MDKFRNSINSAQWAFCLESPSTPGPGGSDALGNRGGCVYIVVRYLFKARVCAGRLGSRGLRFEDLLSGYGALLNLQLTVWRSLPCSKACETAGDATCFWSRTPKQWDRSLKTVKKGRAKRSEDFLGVEALRSGWAGKLNPALLLGSC